jgi:GTPase SAR1 family protein
MFDLTRKQTWQEVQEFWMPKLQEYLDPKAKIIIIGNKKDLEGKR